jgi:hypothetical protein
MIVAFFGAKDVWHWHWALSGAFAFVGPFIIGLIGIAIEAVYRADDQ